MSRRFFVFVFLLAACQSISVSSDTVPTNSTAPTHTAISSPTPPPTAYPTPRPDFTIQIHPENGLYVGDMVSFEVFSQIPLGEGDHQVLVQSNSDPPLEFSGAFSQFGIGRREQATLKWVWDTSDLAPGTYTLTFTILPDGISWQEPVTLNPADQLSEPLRNSTLTYTETDCCLLYYLTHTAAARDIEQIEQLTDQAAEEITALMNVEMQEPIEIFLLPRVLGHGGFATQELYISYLDRNYTDNDLYMVLKHEIVHRLDTQQDADFRPPILLEGYAVYLSGGHFKPEPLMERTAPLLELGLYIPISTMVDDFYDTQHEIGYLESAALIEFMVDTWGIETFNEFYLHISPPRDGDTAQAIDTSLQEHYGLTLQEMEDQFIEALNQIPPDPALTADVQLTVNYFDTVRAYQQVLDPSAYFLNAWLVFLDELKEKDIAADVLRHPEQPANITLEVMLIEASSLFQQGQYQQAQDLLDVINLVLGQIRTYQPDPFSIHPTAQAYHTLIQTALKNGYEIANISLQGDQAVLLVNTEYGAQLFSIEVNKQEVGLWNID